MAEEQSGNLAALLGALKDLRVSAQISLSVAATSAILLVATWSAPIVAFEPSIINWRAWLSLGTVGGPVFFLMGLATDYVKMRRDKRAADNLERFQNQARVKTLEQLTIHEQNTIRNMLMSASRANFVSDSDPVQTLLVKRDIFVIIGSPLPTPKGMPMQSPAHIADWAWDYLREHPELVGLKKESLPPIGQDVEKLRNKSS